MEKNYTIKDVSELLNIPKSTIRYWDEQGLISTTRNEENGYRTFDLEDLFKIYDIDFYRKMGIPIKDMLNLCHHGSNRRTTGARNKKAST